ncbi:MAG: membrane protein insertion efficiency factor YidD [Chloroflexi bacterium]|nr:membrane protein insertion efficiency factor YidD [Chloroflexota bacterium]MYD47079.1 membrane protein insertion efficiency factor YidD [Chloroflexota bacterium]
MKAAALLLIRLYQQALSPYLPSVCRFQPSCSQYMAEAVEQYGVARGAWLGVRRILRCRPLGRRGYDPVV